MEEDGILKTPEQPETELICIEPRIWTEALMLLDEFACIDTKQMNMRQFLSLQKRFKAFLNKVAD